MFILSLETKRSLCYVKFREVNKLNEEGRVYSINLIGAYFFFTNAFDLQLSINLTIENLSKLFYYIFGTYPNLEFDSFIISENGFDFEVYPYCRDESRRK